MIFIYDHTGKRVTTVPVPANDLTTFGYTEREIAVLRPLVTSMIEVRKFQDAKVAKALLSSLTWGLSRRMVTEGHVRDMRINLDVTQDLLTPPDPERHSLFAKFLYDYKGQSYEGRFILATKTFDVPDQSAVRKL